MAQTQNKTQATGTSVDDFIASADDRRADEANVVDAMMRRVTGVEPKMWGPSIIGYGSYAYRYDSGREGTSCRIGFSPRKAQIVIYLVGNFDARQDEADALFARLGKHSSGKACLYIKRLADVDLAALEALLALDWDVMNRRYPA